MLRGLSGNRPTQSHVHTVLCCGCVMCAVVLLYRCRLYSFLQCSLLKVCLQMILWASCSVSTVVRYWLKYTVPLNVDLSFFGVLPLKPADNCNSRLDPQAKGQVHWDNPFRRYHMLMRQKDLGQSLLGCVSRTLHYMLPLILSTFQRFDLGLMLLVLYACLFKCVTVSTSIPYYLC